MANPIRIAHDADFPPLAFVDGGESRGLIIDLLRAVFARMGREARFVAIPLAGHEAALRADEVDALGFKATIPEFREIYDMSAPLVVTGAAWFAPRSAAWAGSDPPEGAHVVTPGRGPLVGLLRRDHAGLRLTTVESYAEALAAVAEGTADVAALNYHVGGHLAHRDHPDAVVVPTAPFEPQPTAFCVLKGEGGALIGDFDSALAELRRDGTAARLEREWLPTASE